MKFIQLILVTFFIISVSPAKATDVPLISTEKFNSEWRGSGFPDVLKEDDGTPLFLLNVTVTLEWMLDENGQLASISVVEEFPENKGYAEVIIAAMRDSSLEPKTSNPTLPARIRGTFEFRSR